MGRDAQQIVVLGESFGLPSEKVVFWKELRNHRDVSCKNVVLMCRKPHGEVADPFRPTLQNMRGPAKMCVDLAYYRVSNRRNAIPEIQKYLICQ
jgi:hypothetical protein